MKKMSLLPHSCWALFARCLERDERSLDLRIWRDFLRTREPAKRETFTFAPGFKQLGGGGITRTDLEPLAVSFDSATPDEQQQTIWVFSRIILGASLSTDSFIFAVSWLLQKASPSLSELAKYWIIDSATNLAEDDRFDAAELTLSVQPVSAESKGSWNRLEAFLVSLLQKDVSRFVSFSLRLAERSAREWLAIMQQPRNLEWLISEMQGKELGEMVGSLVLSDRVACRKLGFFLFDALSLTSLPDALLAPVSEKKTANCAP